MVQKSDHDQLRLVVHPIISEVLYIPGGCFGFLKHQQQCETKLPKMTRIDPYASKDDVLGVQSHAMASHRKTCVFFCWELLFKDAGRGKVYSG